MVRGEAPHNATVSVPDESVLDGSRILSPGPLMCRNEGTELCLTSLLSSF